MRQELPATVGIAVNLSYFARQLPAENLSPRIQEIDTESARQLGGFLSGLGIPQNVSDLRREHVRV